MKPTYEELERRVQELQESEIYYRTLFENVNDAVLVHEIGFDGNPGKFIDANRIALERLGYTHDELLKLTPKDITTENGYKELSKARANVISNSAAIFETTHCARNGRPIPVESHVSVVELAGQRVAVSVVRDLSERKRTEEDLQKSEEQFRDLYDNAPVGYFEYDLWGNITRVNHTYLWMLGYSAEEVIGQPCWEFIVDEIAREQIMAKLDGFRPPAVGLERTYRRKDGATLPVLFQDRLLLDEDGHIKGIRTAIQDITERKWAKEENRRFRTISDNAVYGKAIADLQGNLLYVNRFFANIHGYEPEQLIGKHFSLFHSREQVETADRLNASMMREGHFTPTTVWHCHRDGTEFPMLMSGILIKDDNGNLQCIAASAIDMTAQYQAENALRESEAKYRTMMEAIKDPLYICSENHKIQYMNKAMLDRIGHYATGELCYEVLYGFKKKCQWCKYDETFIGDHVEKNIISPLDNRSFNVSSTVFVNESGSISKLSVFRDTTEFLELQKRLQQSQKMESIGSLAGGIAHDFNNLLFPIVGLSEMMLNDFPQDSIERKNIQEIFNAGTRGRELVQQILSFSRQSEHQPIPVHIQQILKEVLKLCRSTIPADIPITRDIMTDCGPVMADPTQIHQIAMNLITNAYHAVEPAGGTISIQLTEADVTRTNDPAGVLTPGRYAVLSFSDTGIGIDGAVIDKIFDPYFTTKEKGRGTGLGLATVYGIVKAHGGDIRVYSDIGKGATFHVYLPLMEKAQESEPEKEMTPLPTGTGHILLVDDEKVIVHLEKQMLERLGYQTSIFTSSTDALTAFKTEPSQFDLVITDMNMPNMNGMQLAAELIAVRPDIPIILCTGFSERINSEKAKAMGMRGLLMKPAGMKDLAQKVREVLD